MSVMEAKFVEMEANEHPFVWRESKAIDKDNLQAIITANRSITFKKLAPKSNNSVEFIFVSMD